MTLTIEVVLGRVEFCLTIFPNTIVSHLEASKWYKIMIIYKLSRIHLHISGGMQNEEDFLCDEQKISMIIIMNKAIDSIFEELAAKLKK